MNTAEVTSMIDGLDMASTPEDYQRARDAVRVLGDYVKDAKDRIDDSTLEWIAENGRDMVIGTVRYYRGTPKSEKCRDAAGTMTVMLDVSDLTTISGCLSANAWKPAACRQVLGDRYGEFFETIEKVELLEGKPTKTLQSMNTRFVK